MDVLKRIAAVAGQAVHVRILVLVPEGEVIRNDHSVGIRVTCNAAGLVAREGTRECADPGAIAFQRFLSDDHGPVVVIQALFIPVVGDVTDAGVPDRCRVHDFVGIHAPHGRAIGDVVPIRTPGGLVNLEVVCRRIFCIVPIAADARVGDHVVYDPVLVVVQPVPMRNKKVRVQRSHPEVAGFDVTAGGRNAAQVAPVAQERFRHAVAWRWRWRDRVRHTAEAQVAHQPGQKAQQRQSHEPATVIQKTHVVIGRTKPGGVGRGRPTGVNRIAAAHARDLAIRVRQGSAVGASRAAAVHVYHREAVGQCATNGIRPAFPAGEIGDRIVAVQAVEPGRARTGRHVPVRRASSGGLQRIVRRLAPPGGRSPTGVGDRVVKCVIRELPHQRVLVHEVVKAGVTGTQVSRQLHVVVHFPAARRRNPNLVAVDRSVEQHQQIGTGQELGGHLFRTAPVHPTVAAPADARHEFPCGARAVNAWVMVGPRPLPAPLIWCIYVQADYDGIRLVEQVHPSPSAGHLEFVVTCPKMVLVERRRSAPIQVGVDQLDEVPGACPHRVRTHTGSCQIRHQGADLARGQAAGFIHGDVPHRGVLKGARATVVVVGDDVVLGRIVRCRRDTTGVRFAAAVMQLDIRRVSDIHVSGLVFLSDDRGEKLALGDLVLVGIATIHTDALCRVLAGVRR